MEVIPAIDIRGGKCVRLFQGDFAQETVFSEDPVAMAQRWAALGAPRLHVVDLDGAATGEPVHLPIIEGIIRSVQCPVQVGGGIRTLEVVEKLLALGAQRVVLGTAALENPQLVKTACRRFRDAVIVAVDAREGKVATRGWVQRTDIPVEEVITQTRSLGVQRFLYTDISRDGTLAGPDFEAIGVLIKRAGAAIIASGGIATLDHLRMLAALGVEGAVVGRALYTGAIDLAQALVEVRGPS